MYVNWIHVKRGHPALVGSKVIEKTKKIIIFSVLIPDYEFENVEQLIKDERCIRVVTIFTKVFSGQKNYLTLVDKAYEEQTLRQTTFLLPIQFENDDDEDEVESSILFKQTKSSFRSEGTKSSIRSEGTKSSVRSKGQETVHERGNIEEMPLAQGTYS